MAVMSQFEVGGKRIVPWVGGYTVVALSRRGDVAAQSNPVGRVYEKYGRNLYPYALAKAVFRMHLDLTGRRSGLNDLGNFSYIESLGFKRGEDLFLGESLVVARNGNYYIGASGCEFKEEYAKELLPPAMREHYSVDFVAGHADMYFARFVASFIQIPGDVPDSLEEPEFFSQLRIAH